MALLVTLASVACAELSPDSAPEEVVTDASGALPPANSTGNTTSDGSEWTVSLLPVNESGVSAVAMIVHRDDIVVAVIEADGLPEPGAYPLKLFGGTCDDAGDEVLTLDPVIGLPDGTGESMTTLGATEFPPEGPHAVRILGAGMAPLACAPLTVEAAPAPTS